MKYNLKAKRDRNQRIVGFHKAHPDYTHKAIAGIFHMKRSRVSQILGKTDKEGGGR